MIRMEAQYGATWDNAEIEVDESLIPALLPAGAKIRSFQIGLPTDKSKARGKALVFIDGDNVEGVHTLFVKTLGLERIRILRTFGKLDKEIGA